MVSMVACNYHLKILGAKIRRIKFKVPGQTGQKKFVRPSLLISMEIIWAR
jgi:hypothetical protein